MCTLHGCVGREIKHCHQIVDALVKLYDSYHLFKKKPICDIFCCSWCLHKLSLSPCFMNERVLLTTDEEAQTFLCLKFNHSSLRSFVCALWACLVQYTKYTHPVLASTMKETFKTLLILPPTSMGFDTICWRNKHLRELSLSD